MALSGNSATLGATTGAVTVSGSGAILDLGTTTQTTGALTLSNGGTIQNGTLQSSSYDVSNGTINAVLADGVSASALTKTGVGTVTLSGANTYSGGTTVSNGTLALSGNSATLGATTGAVTVSGSGAILDLGTTTQTTGALTLSNGGTIQNGTLQSSSYDVSNGTINAVLADDTSASALTKTGVGTVTLYGANTYSGGTTISNGTLALSGMMGSISNSTNVKVAGGATLDISAVTTAISNSNISFPLTGTTINTLSGGGTINLGGTPGNAVGNALYVIQNSDATFSGTITGTATPLTSCGNNCPTQGISFIKDGSGKLTLDQRQHL